MADIPSTLRTMTMRDGECLILPEDAIIHAIIPTGNIELTSTCGDLPAPSGYKCWQFRWEYTAEANFADAYMESIEINGITYPLVSTDEVNEWDNDGNFLASSIPLSVPLGLCNVLCNTGGPSDNPKLFVVEVPEALGTPKIRYINPDYDMGDLIPYEDICECGDT